MRARSRHRFLGVAAGALLLACGDSRSPGASPAEAGAPADASVTCAPGVGKGAFSTALTPRQPPEHYVVQGNKYFDAIDATVSDDSVPTYSPLVARWEWPPWLKLTGYTEPMMTRTDHLLKTVAPAAIAPRDCRSFAVQPFARCRVSFKYTKMGDGKPCGIYEEFTFNDQGEITFVEAWSDLPQLLPTANPSDRWAEGRGVHRLSTRVPGLGTPTGRIDPGGACMKAAAATDAEVADFAARAADFWPSWTEENTRAGADYFTRGCGW